MNFPIGTILTAVILSVAGIWAIKKRKQKTIPADLFNKLVFITGCDSGLGFSLALHCHELGMNVCASMLNPGGEAGEQLQILGQGTERLHVIGVDVTDATSVQKGVEAVKELLKTGQLELHAIVNNAGVMVFAENEWQTEQMIKQQIEVNLIGAIRVTKLFSPLLRKYQSRVINITSHCALEPLPGLSVYSASKAGLKMWSDGIRVELAKYGIKVITFIPGSFFGQSNILSQQVVHAEEMKKAMSSEDFNFYSDYFNRFNSYLRPFSGERPKVQLKNEQLYKNLNHLLLSPYPKAYYCVSPRRYAIYHFLFKISPTWMRDKLVERFIQMPKFKN